MGLTSVDDNQNWAFPKNPFDLISQWYATILSKKTSILWIQVSTRAAVGSVEGKNSANLENQFGDVSTVWESFLFYLDS